MHRVANRDDLLTNAMKDVGNTRAAATVPRPTALRRRAHYLDRPHVLCTLGSSVPRARCTIILGNLLNKGKKFAILRSRRDSNMLEMLVEVT